MKLIDVTKTNEILSEALFKSDKIEGMSMFLSQHFLDDNFYWRGEIRFKDKDLTGTKKFKVEGIDGLEELLKQMNNFIKGL